MTLNKKLLNFMVIIVLTFGTFWWAFFIFHIPFDMGLVLSVLALRVLSSFAIYSDYSLSWSKATQKTFLIKSIVYVVPFLVYAPYFHGEFRFAFLASELFVYLFAMNFLMYAYYYVVNKSKVAKTKDVVIYGAGRAGMKLYDEFRNSDYKVRYFCDDDSSIQGRSVDGVKILSANTLKSKLSSTKYDLLVIAMPSMDQQKIQDAYDSLSGVFDSIKILPSLEDILMQKEFSTQLKDISVEDLLARHPKDLDKSAIEVFVCGKKVLVTGAGGSIGSEIVRQCAAFGAGQIIILDHSEYNLYAIEQELNSASVVPVMQSVVNVDDLDRTFARYMPDIVIHAAAYKHVPLVEANISEAIRNNIIGTKNVIDVSCKYGVKKVVLISTDKAVRPTNVMGTTKRVCELYAQNKVAGAFGTEVSTSANLEARINLNSSGQMDAYGNPAQDESWVPDELFGSEVSTSPKTDIVAVRFGNVLGSSGSVIPKFKSQIEKGQNITVTHPDITRYFMLIPEACELVLQAGSLAKGGEIFILDMGEPIKIVDLAAKMIELSGKDGIGIEFCGLRPGEKLYEELLIDDSDATTKYESITVAAPTRYDIDELNADIQMLIECEDDESRVAQLKKIVPEFDHKLNK